MTDGTSVTSVVVPFARSHRIRAALTRKVALGALAVTDCYETFRAFSMYGCRKSIVEFSPEMFWSEEGRQITGFVSYFKRSLRLQHRHVSEHRLWKYLKEYEFRYNRRFTSQSTFPSMIACFPSIDGDALQNVNFIPPPAHASGDPR